jgi:hypothetical protein
MGGGAWPFLVGGVICLVNSDNERDLNLLTSGDNLLLGEVGFRSRYARKGGTGPAQWILDVLSLFP